MNGYHQKPIIPKSNQNLFWRTVKNNIKLRFTGALNIQSFLLLPMTVKRPTKALMSQTSRQYLRAHVMSEQISSLFIKYESSLRLATDSSRKCCMKREGSLISNKDHFSVSIQWHKMMTQSLTHKHFVLHKFYYFENKIYWGAQRKCWLKQF